MLRADGPTDPRRKLVMAAFSQYSQVKVFVSSLAVCESVEEGKLI